MRSAHDAFDDWFDAPRRLRRLADEATSASAQWMWLVEEHNALAHAAETLLRDYAVLIRAARVAIGSDRALMEPPPPRGE